MSWPRYIISIIFFVNINNFYVAYLSLNEEEHLTEYTVHTVGIFFVQVDVSINFIILEKKIH